MDLESSSSRRKVGRPAKRSKIQISAATDFSNIDLDEKPQSGKQDQPSQQVLEKIVIPVNGRSSNGSSLTSNHDLSSGYDTPVTSVVVTPAESLLKERSLRRPTELDDNSHQCQKSFMPKRKRKHMELDELAKADALLAQNLQEQEYGVCQTMNIRSGGVHRGLLDDSGESLLSDLSGEDLVDLEDSLKFEKYTPRKQRRRRSKALPSRIAPVVVQSGSSERESIDRSESPGISRVTDQRLMTDRRTSLPSRAARDWANKSIQDNISRKILNSEDSDVSIRSDDVSLFGSDTVSEATDDSEDIDVEAANVADSLNNSSTAVAATAIQTTGRRGVPSATATIPNRGRRSWQRRVEDRVRSETPLIMSS